MMEYQNLIGLQPLLGERDCFSLVRAFFQQNFGIQIANLARPKDWDADDIDLINMCHEREGFQKITDWKIADLRPADVLCMSIGSRNPNHFAILVDDGNLLHHPSGRLSTVEPYRDFWRKVTSFVLRHPDVPDLRPQKVEVDIMELLRARYSLQPD